jgi:tetratricopeptide (TPR) repeat protein
LARLALALLYWGFIRSIFGGFVMPDAPILPKSYEAMYVEAYECARRGDSEGAIAMLERILKRLSSLSPETLARAETAAELAFMVGRQLADLYSGTGRYDEAAALLPGLARFLPGREAELTRVVARVRLEEGDFEAALGIATELTGQYPHEAVNWNALGDIQFSRGDFDEAEKSYKRSLAEEPTGFFAPDAWRRLFRLYSEQGLVERADEAWDRMAALDSEAAAEFAGDLYSFLLEAGALSRLRQRLSASGPTPAAELYRGLLEEREGDRAQARRRWQRLISEDPTELAHGQVEWGEAAIRVGELDAAIAVLSMIRVDAPVVDRRLLLLAIAQALVGQIDLLAETLGMATRELTRSLPRRALFGRREWKLFTSLVADRRAREAAKPYFAVVEVAQP